MPDAPSAPADPQARVAGPAGAGAHPPRTLAPWHAAVVALVVAGAAAQVLRPLAPETGPALDAATWFDPGHLARVEAYRTPRYAWSLVSLLVRVALPCLVAFTPAGRRLVGALVARAGAHRRGRAATAVVLGVLVATDLVLLPIAFWSGYVHEGAFGFRTQGLGGWAYDWLLARVPTWVAAAVLVPAGYALARRLPRAWPPVAALAAAALGALAVLATPLVLEPLRFDTEPLPDGPVRAEVERVLARAGEEVDGILVADASRRTTKTNAYVSGLGPTRRVVLYDTLVASQPAPEVGLILAHELGHRRHHDVARGTLAGAAGVAVLVYAIAAVLRRRSAGGRQRGVADPAGAAVALAVVVVLNVGSLPLQQAISRRAEAAADHAALRISGDPDTFLAAKEALARSNLSDPDPPGWVYALWYSHPSVAERLTMGERARRAAGS